MDLFKLVGRVAINNKDANSAIDQTTGKAKEGQSKMVESFKAIGTAVATYFTVDKIIQFGKACVESAATVQAANAQFEAAFGELQDAATQRFQAIGDETGILATRLQGVGTKAFSQFKGAGLDAAEALEKMDVYSRIAADGAAYYDMSLEEVDGLLRSFIRGNTEAGDRLGLFTSESQRNEAALQKLGKKYIECTEAEKQMIMLDIAQSIYDASGATGQAAREADGYENVMGNLKEAWKQFQAVVGAPILQNVVVPAVQAVTQGLLWMGEKLKAANDFYQQHKAILEPIVIILGSIAGVIAVASAGIAIYNIAAGIMAVVNGVLTGSFIALLAPMLPILVVIGLIVAAGILLYKNWDTIKEKAGQLKDWLSEKWSAIKENVGGKIEDLKTSASEKFNAIKNNVESATNTAKDVASNGWGALTSFLKGDTEGMKNHVMNLWNMLPSGIQDKLTNAYNVVSTKFNQIKDAVITPVQNVVDRVRGFFDQIRGILSGNLPFPKIKLPHFSINGSFSLNPPSVPRLGVEWYAKGAVLNKPTAFGLNGKNVMAGGEAGPEAVAPISVLQGYIADAVASQNNAVVEILTKILAVLIQLADESGDFTLSVGDKDMAAAIYPEMSKLMGLVKMRSR